MSWQPMSRNNFEGVTLLAGRHQRIGDRALGALSVAASIERAVSALLNLLMQAFPKDNPKNRSPRSRVKVGCFKSQQQPPVNRRRAAFPHAD